MGRILLQAVLPFLAPFVVYLIYRLLVQRGGRVLDRGPWLGLTVAGLVLVCLSFASLAFFGGAPAGSEYIPPHVENGRIVPGRFEAPGENPAVGHEPSPP